MLKKPKPEDLKLNNEINSVLDTMSIYGPDSPEYPKLLDHLNSLKSLQKANRAAWKPSGDQMALVLGNFAGIAFLVSYEHMHALTTKVLPLLVKPR